MRRDLDHSGAKSSGWVIRMITRADAFRPAATKSVVQAFWAVFCLALAYSAATAGAQNAVSASKTLTVERIFAGPSLNGSLTQGVEWSPNGKRISFFQPAANDASKTGLWVMEASTGKKSVLVDSGKLARFLQPEKSAAIQSTGLGRVAPEEYAWAPDGNALLFRSGGRLVWVDLGSLSARVLVDSKEDLSDPKFSPDGKWVSYLQDGNIWLANVSTKSVKQLTSGGSEDLLEGQLDWVYPEELDLATAYWWSPDSQKIAFLQFNENPVTKYPIVDLNGKVETTRYPQAGEANPIVRIGVEAIRGGEPEWIDTGANTDVYIPRVDWVPDGKSLLVQRLNRAQNKLEVLLADAATGASHTILAEQDRYWVNVSDLPIRFFADGKRFLWTSERSGFCHIYIYNIAGNMLGQLTSGNWEVSGGEGFGPSVGDIFDLDEAHGYVYFLSNKDNPIERQLYRVSIATKTVTRVTTEAGTHNVLISPDGSAFMDTFSDAMTPPSQIVTRPDGTQIGVLNENAVPELAEYQISPVEFLTVRAEDGTELNASMIKPANFDPARKHPVLVYVYGGPHVQIVTNVWGGNTFLWHELMAEKGYIVFSIDNRGSYGRGHKFETPLFHQFGKVELADQIAGVNYLKTLPYVDPARIGIYGGSYGGYMTLEALFNAPDIFKAGAAIAPVSDWRLYDTIYTERYMGRPQDNAAGYDQSSPASQAGNLKGKLLLAHGTGDDNVHFANTTEVLNELIEHGSYANDLVILPGRGHGMSDTPAQVELYKELTKFFLDNL
jgi:dipeptidyl-peptidase-4